MPEGKKRTFDDDDLFQRKPYAEFLKNLILNCDNYHRDDDLKAYTIALDSPWGTGKSVFLEKFEVMLAQKCSDTICVVHYNAWKNDFWSNAFEPFVEALFSSECFAKLLLDQSEGKAAQKFISACKDFGIAFLKGQLEKQIDVDRLDKSLQGFKSAFDMAVDQKPDAVTDNYRTYTKHLKELQNAMEDFLDEALPNGKLLIVVDELDRCKPTFAIETLEIVKHIMDVPNVVYLFALDIHQLGAAVKQVYGAETDSVGYLMRFFSYYARMPEAKKQYIVETIANKLDLQIHDDCTDPVQLIHDESVAVYKDSIQKLKSEMVKVSNALGLSVRDLETVGKVYELMHRIFLKRYQNRCAYLLYWLLLCSKYKQPLLFDEWMNSKNSEIDYPFPSEQADDLPNELLGQIDMLSNQDPMKFVSFSVRESPNDSYEASDKIVVATMDENSTAVAVDYEDEVQTYGHTFTKYIEARGDISGVLFLPDLLNWRKINHLTLRQYYCQQLEMYTFLPTIE